jgi:hypothetical protein
VLLADSDIRRAIDSVQAAFVNFSEWEYSNETDDFYAGFSLWGTFDPDPNEPMPRSFFVTFDTHGSSWMGHLTIGQHCYYWSSADVGDANLMDTHPCATLDDAISALKAQLAGLFKALSA